MVKLNELEKIIKSSLIEGRREIDISPLNLTINQDVNIIQSIFKYSPYLYFLFGNSKVYYNEKNVFTRIVVDDVDINIINNIKSQIDFMLLDFREKTKNLDNEKKALYVHDYFITNYEYDYDNYLNNTTPYSSYTSGGLLLNRIAVCDGYAHAYQYIMNYLGIKTYVVSSEKMNHAWNIVNLDNTYYHVDCTYDDPVVDRYGLVAHNYFLISDDNICNKGHSGWNTDLVCDNTKYDNYYWTQTQSPICIDEMNNIYYTYYDDFERSSYVIKNDISNKIINLGIWNVSNGSSFWPGAFSGLFIINNELYYNTQSEIKKYSVETNKESILFTNTTTNNSIYGIRLEDNKIKYVLKSNPNEKGAVSFVNYDLNVDPINIQFEQLSYTIKENEKRLIKLTVSPNDATYKMSFTIDNNSVASVDKDGYVTGLTVGRSQLTATTDKGLIAQCTIIVEHDWQDIYTVDVQQTCTQDGKKSIHCNQCKEINDEQIIKATGHLHLTVRNRIEPSCQSEGYSGDKYCLDCKDIVEKGYTLDKLEHIWNSDYTIDKQPTFDEYGQKSIHCKICNVINQNTIKQIPKLENKWIQSGDKWWYKHADGTYTKDNWEEIDGKWYLFDKDGWMLTGWQRRNNRWYYFNQRGQMQTGLQSIGNNLCYFNESGAMQTGWQKVNNIWYYFNASGYAINGWHKINNKWYYFKNYQMQTGLQSIGNNLCYFNESGAMQTGWQKINNIWYYFNVSGYAINGWHKINNKWYYFKNYQMQTGWLEIGVKKYYLNENGEMVIGRKMIDGVSYLFNNDGELIIA